MLVIIVVVVVAAATAIIQFNRYLLTCRLNSTIANYKARTRTQIQHKNNTNTQKRNIKQKKTTTNIPTIRKQQCKLSSGTKKHIL
jgi:hypothetical protein